MKLRNSKTQELTKLVYAKGYRIIDNDCYNPKGKKLNGSIKMHPVPYRQLSIKTEMGARSIFYHALLAYQIYGDLYFEQGTVVRHLDGNSLNNTPENLKLGSPRDNKFDIPAHTRSDIAFKSVRTVKKLTPEIIAQIKNDYLINGIPAKQLYIKYNTCLNTMYILIRKFKQGVL
jgi:hypothetical protein